jgi:hypothetical protein
MKHYIIYNCVYFHQHNFSINTLQVNYLLHVSAFRPSSGMHIRCWLHHSPLTLASVHSEYILCCRFDTLGCNATTYALFKMLGIKIVKLLTFLECCWFLSSFIIKAPLLTYCLYIYVQSLSQTPILFVIIQDVAYFIINLTP